MQNWVELHLKPAILKRYGLPDIPYCITQTDLQAVISGEEDLPLAVLLNGLQQRSRDAGVQWQEVEPAMDRIAELLAPDDAREVISATGDHWWLEIGPLDLSTKLVTIQLRTFDAAKAGAKLAVASLIALCGALLRKSLRGGLIVVGEINLGGSIEPIHNAVTIAKIAVEKGAQALLVPVSCRRQLYDLSDDMATKVDIQFYQDARDALLKALVE